MAPARTAALALAALGAAAASVPTPPTFASVYSLEGTITLPYANITEPFLVFTDLSAGSQTVYQYGGMDVYVYVSQLNVTWQVNPVVNTFECFTTNGSLTVSAYIPDISTYTFIGSGVVDGVNVNLFQTNVTNEQRVNTYTMAVAMDDSPVHFSMLGYDFVLGSHFDQYEFAYSSYKPGQNALPPNIFAQPAPICGPFPTAPSEGGSARAFLDFIAELIPQGAAPAPEHPLKDKAFAEFLAAYGKSYGTEQELRQRHAAFTRSRRLIHAHNRKAIAEGRSLRLGMNFMGDALEHEMAQRRGVSVNRGKQTPKQPLKGAARVHPPADGKTLPASVDWRLQGAVEPVPDQGICGSCWAHGATGMLAGQRFLKYGVMEVLSKQEIMDCSWMFGNYACDGGEDFLAYEWIMQNGGLATRADYGPYLMADGSCNAAQTPVSLQVTSYVNVTSGSQSALMDALANVGPISISIDADDDTFTFYSSGTFDDPNCMSGMQYQDHTVLAVGYGTDAGGNGYWIVRNSWSTHWGNQGYILIAQAGNICGVTDAPTYASIA